jgi:hypothetical protein
MQRQLVSEELLLLRYCIRLLELLLPVHQHLIITGSFVLLKVLDSNLKVLIRNRSNNIHLLVVLLVRQRSQQTLWEEHGFLLPYQFPWG